MIRSLAIFAIALSCTAAEEAVEIFAEAGPEVPLAPSAVPVAPAAGIVTARSQQYFARNYNALVAPVIAPVQTLAPLQAFAPVQPAVARAPLVVDPFASSVQYSQYTQFAPNFALPVAPIVSGTPVATRPVEPVQPVLPDDVVEIEAARLRQLPVNARNQRRERENVQKERSGAPQKLVQEVRPVAKSSRLVAAPILAASAPLTVPAVPAVQRRFGVPYFL